MMRWHRTRQPDNNHHTPGLTSTVHRYSIYMTDRQGQVVSRVAHATSVTAPCAVPFNKDPAIAIAIVIAISLIVCGTNLAYRTSYKHDGQEEPQQSCRTLITLMNPSCICMYNVNRRRPTCTQREAHRPSPFRHHSQSTVLRASALTARQCSVAPTKRK